MARARLVGLSWGIPAAVSGVRSAVIRRRLPWVLAVPLIATGSMSAHALGSVLFGGHGHEHGAEEVARTSGGYLAQLPILLGVLAALGLAGLGVRMFRARRRGTHGVAPLWFLLLPPLSFALQELAERLLHAESAPFSAVREPAFLAALLLQLPFGLLAYLLARFLLAIAEDVGGLLSRHAAFPQACRSVLLPVPLMAARPRRPVLASGQSERGPPVLVRSS